MSEYAYVTVMYGNNIYLTGALVLGYTLCKTKTKYDRIILVTPDVSDLYKSYLSKMYTKIIDIDYVKVNPNIFFEQETRFRDVFTKLACLNLIEYEKIILLDLDMIISKNIDHLFKLNPPAACLKRYHISYGKKIPSQMICNNHKLTGSINAGLMLLKPDEKEWVDIQNDIMNNNQINKYKYPEQDYLSLRYCGQWTSITFNYNFQFGLTNRVKKYSYNINNIYVIHYSSSYKPWNILISNRQITNEEKKFIDQHKKYYDLWINIYEKIKSKYQKNNNILLPY
ncbi:glycosyltransferase [Moumouvirus goulette]|uniref:Glycosyltransferase n=1 Tax=Moumouvirus goulette TaxID=1247379 RepID=M1NND2_9VIRU|nr:glycosyltransferase [Moumouvirus goulette]AGF85565.1 glycosyltransferase [Moumouvirus goulette]